MIETAGITGCGAQQTESKDAVSNSFAAQTTQNTTCEGGNVSLTDMMYTYTAE